MTRFLRPAWFKFFVLIFGLLTAAQITSATTIVPMSDDEIIIGARAIVAGKILAIESSFALCGPVSEEASIPASPGVSMMPGLSALTRMRRSFRSAVHVRANDRTAALVAL